MESKFKLSNIAWVNTIFLTVVPVLAIIGIYHWASSEEFSWGIINLALVLYILNGLGITVGYHRLFSHRSFKTNSFVKFILLITGACAIQNSALKWSSDHRRHHLKSDTPEDPYSIKRGFFFAHMGWIFLKEDKVDYSNVKDLQADKLVMLQHKYYIPIIAVFSFLLPTLLGHYLYNSALGGFFVAGLMRITFLHHCTFFINSLCHTLGKKTYDPASTARDSWITALFTFGEGYHNYHHTFQTDYRNGIRWYQFDPSKWIIKFLSYLGLAWNLKVVDPYTVQVRIIKNMFHDSEVTQKLLNILKEYKNDLKNFDIQRELYLIKEGEAI